MIRRAGHAIAEVAARRDDAAREIFRSFSWGEARIDPAVLGSWVQAGGDVSGGYAGDYGATERSRQYWFAADGSARYPDEASVSVEVEGLSGTSESSDDLRGTFAAGDGILYIRFDDGEEQEFRYTLVGDGSGAPMLQLTTADGTVTSFHRAG